MAGRIAGAGTGPAGVLTPAAAARLALVAFVAGADRPAWEAFVFKDCAKPAGARQTAAHQNRSWHERRLVMGEG